MYAGAVVLTAGVDNGGFTEYPPVMHCGRRDAGSNVNNKYVGVLIGCPSICVWIFRNGIVCWGEMYIYSKGYCACYRSVCMML